MQTRIILYNCGFKRTPPTVGCIFYDGFVSDKAVSKWETGGSIPDVALLMPLAKLLVFYSVSRNKSDDGCNTVDAPFVWSDFWNYSMFFSERKAADLLCGKEI